MFIVQKKITWKELMDLAEQTFGDLVKAVVDVEREIMAVDAELHSDEEDLLIENGSEQKNLWGINLCPGLANDGFIEFDSMINLRPSLGNLSRGVDDPGIREKIIFIVNRWVER